MLNFKWLSLIFILSLLIFSSCRKPLPTLEGIDREGWQADKNGCEGKRAAMLKTMEQEKSKLLALKETEIVQLLGRPDQNELYKRNQKFFYYYLQPGPLCSQDSTSNATKLMIRFNAMGLAKEVVLQ